MSDFFHSDQIHSETLIQSQAHLFTNSVSVSLIYRKLNLISDPNPGSASALIWQPELISSFLKTRLYTDRTFVFANINEYELESTTFQTSQWDTSLRLSASMPIKHSF